MNKLLLLGRCPIMIGITGEILHHLGYVVVTRLAGFMQKDFLQFRAVFIDDDTTMAGELQIMAPQLPILFLHAATAPRGLGRTLAKPFSMKDLTRSVDQLLSELPGKHRGAEMGAALLNMARAR